jgi:Helix-turn-helix domain
VLRAAARVFELRCSGFPIETRRVVRRGSAPIFEYRLSESATSDGLDPDAELERIRRKFPDLGASA